MTRSSAPDIEVAALDSARIALESYAWPFAAEHRQRIATCFADLQRRRPGVWNGRVLLARGCRIEGDSLRGACFETDFASFCAWREWAFPDPAIVNIFAAAVLRSADGAYLLGEMAPFTANAGSLYFPCGTPEPADIDADGLLDLQRSVGRELLEETGIDAGELLAERGWTMVRDGCYLALLKRVAAPQSAAELRDRIRHHLAQQQQSELADIRFVRTHADLDPAMPRFVGAFLAHAWA